MATASFFRTLPQDNDLRQDGADSRKAAEVFQMVPTGGSRRGEISVDGGIVRLQSADQNIVQIAPGPNLPPVQTITFNQPTLSGLFMLIGGPTSGKTVIVAEDQNGRRLDHLAVSVKDEVSVKYHLLRLKDAVRDDAMERSQAETILKNVEQLYLSQTNVRLTKLRSEDLFIQRILSDDKRVLQLDEKFDNKEDIIFGQILANGFPSSDVVFVFTWKIEGGFFISTELDGRCESPVNLPKRAISRNGPTVIYVNTFAPQGKHAFTAAHELGHHFGMSHFASSIISRRPPNYLMEPPARGFKMTQDDINLANRTGT